MNKRFPPGAFFEDCEPLVRKVIAAHSQDGMAELGSQGKFIYLVRDTIETSLLEIHEQLAMPKLLRLNECLAPYVGATLLRCGIWWDGKRHEIYIDETKECIVHQAVGSHPDPEEARG